MKFYVLARVSGENYSVSIESRRDGLRVAQDVVLGKRFERQTVPRQRPKITGMQSWVNPGTVLVSTQAWGAGTTADWFAGSLLASSSYTSLRVTM